MDNLTHALVGAALAELALGGDTRRPVRRVFLAAGVIASNLPDIDLVYTGIAPAPLGYLLHHRGHTHTVVGLIVQGLAIAAACLAPPLRRLVREGGAGRFAALVAVGLALHIVLDSWNTYGVHPFWPADSRWLYGDAVFIFEPWLWLFLGLAAAMNARSRRAAVALVALVAVLLLGLAGLGVLPMPSLAALAATGFILAGLARGLSRPQRAAAALAASASFVTLLFASSAVARGRAVAGAPAGREVLDVVVNPNPGWPVCWDIIAIEREADDLVLRRGTLSLAPDRYAPGDCPSHRLDGRPPAPGDAPAAWQPEIRQPIPFLRDLAARDCRVNAWLQFGRAPFLRDGTLADLRFDSSARRNFTAMKVTGEDRACTWAKTAWSWPRADVLRVP